VTASNSNTLEVRELAAVLREALDVPIPASYEDREAHRQLLMTRAELLRGAMNCLAWNGDVTAAARTVRWAVEGHPVTYTPYERQGGGSK
jgi:hypothetical protein